MRLIFALFTLTLTPLAAFAADIEVLPEGPCFARISGQLVEGDADTFIAIEQANPRQYDENYIVLERNKLCLDSPGGSLSEGIKIARHLSKIHIGTRIEKNARCLSACALIFMMGRGGGENENEAWLDREMDITASLGFHRPSLNLPEGGTYTASQINNSFKLALDATLGFVSLANNAGELATIGLLTVDGEAVDVIDAGGFDIVSPAEGTDMAYAVLQIDGEATAGLYAVDLTSGALTNLADLGMGGFSGFAVSQGM